MRGILIINIYYLIFPFAVELEIIDRENQKGYIYIYVAAAVAAAAVLCVMQVTNFAN